MTGEVDCNEFDSAISTLMPVFKSNIISENTDIIHAHHLTYPPIATIGKFNKTELPPIILNIHGSDILSGIKDSKHLKYIKRSCQIADVLVCPSKQLLSDLKKVCSPDLWKNKTTIIPLAVANEMLEYGKRHKEYINKAKFTVLYSGRLTKNKGVHLIIRALSELPKNIILKIAGDGQENKNLKK